jgi:PAS domain S-box-containing protein
MDDRSRHWHIRHRRRPCRGALDVALDFASQKNFERLAIVLLVLALAFVLSFHVETSLIYSITAALLLVSARFGAKVGHPLAFVIVALACIETKLGHGPFFDGGTPMVDGLQAFAALTLAVTAMVSRLVYLVDQSVQEKDRVARRLQKIVGTRYEAFIEIARDFSVIDATDDIQRLAGLPVGSIIGMPLRGLFDEEGWSEVQHFAELVFFGESVRFDRSFRTKGGETRWGLISVEPVLDSWGNFDGCTLFLLDTTLAHELHAERLESRLALEIAEEGARLRLGQLVHDGALQDLAAANLLIGAARLDAPSSSHLHKVESLLVSGMQKLRSDAIGSEILDLDDLGVIAALQQLAAKFSLLDVPVVTVEGCLAESTCSELRSTLFHIAREALVNALVHSGATRIDVCIDAQNSGYAISVLDDGIGFDDGRLQEVGHIGLTNMTALAYRAGGGCSVVSTNGCGTRIDAWIPLLPSKANSVLFGA